MTSAAVGPSPHNVVEIWNFRIANAAEVLKSWKEDEGDAFEQVTRNPDFYASFMAVELLALEYGWGTPAFVSMILSIEKKYSEALSLADKEGATVNEQQIDAYLQGIANSRASGQNWVLK